jgi:hypothetical protein
MTCGSSAVTNTTAESFRYFAKLDATGTALWAISADSTGFGQLSYFGAASGERARFAAQFSQAVSLPGISTITATVGDTVLVEIGPQEISRPALGFSAGGNTIVLAWPTTATNYSLESSTSLIPDSWAPVLPVPVVVGDKYTVTNTMSGGVKFYRLKK